MKPKVEAGITAFRLLYIEGKSTPYKATEVLYQHINEPDTYWIASMKKWDEKQKKYILN